MELVIQGRSVDISPQVRTYVKKKLAGVQRRLPSITQATVELTLEPTRSPDTQAVAEVTLNCNGTILRGEKRAANVQAALDAVVDVMKRRIDRFKGRMYLSERARRSGKTASRRLQASETPGAQESGAPGEAADIPIARVKRFPMKPMAPEEAVRQMELLGHTFFLFYNSADGQFNVVYRRGDGAYGLIQPEME